MVLPWGPYDLGFSWPGVFLLGAGGRTERFFTELLSHNPISLAFANACNACTWFLPCYSAIGRSEIHQGPAASFKF